MPSVRRQAQEGVLPGGDRLQGLGLLPHGQPEERHGRGSGHQGQGQVACRVLLLYLGLRQKQRHGGQARRQEGRARQVLIREREGRLSEAAMADLAEPSRGGHGGSSPMASIAVIGGSGFYEFLEDAEEVAVDTPFGAPSDPITVGEVAGRRVAFLPRHGRDHRFPPHKIPYRANLWALRSIGVRRVLAPTAVGSLTPSYGPGTLAFPDPLGDRPRTRVQTYYDVGACHVPFADPYCPSVRSVAIATAREQGWVPV